MQSVRRNAEHGVAGLNRAAVDDLAAIDNANDATHQIVLAGSIHSGHLRGLTADERAVGRATGLAKSTQKHKKNLGLGFFRAFLDKKKPRPRSEHGNVVDAMIYEIGADGVMLIRRECDL